MSNEQTATLSSEDFVVYDMELMAGRRVYLASLPKSANPHPHGSKKWEWWREGYDQ